MRRPGKKTSGRPSKHWKTSIFGGQRDPPILKLSTGSKQLLRHGGKLRKSFAILSLEVSRDMKSIAAGPLSTGATEIPPL